MKQIFSEQRITGYFRKNGFFLKSGVWCAQSPDASSPAELMYHSLRNKEGWIYPDQIVRQLPDIGHGDQHYGQWRVRKKSFRRLLHYLETKYPFGTILDMGSGNGWMANAFAESGFYVCGLDLNYWELQQAARVFHRSKNVEWLYGDIFSHVVPYDSMDAVVLASSLQYFDDVGRLLKTLFQTLHNGGEIHIIDTPFYRDHEKKEAVRRSQDYYARIGYPDFAVHYRHRTYEELEPYPYSVLYNPTSITNVLKRFIDRSSSQFPWIIIKKP